MRTPSKSTLPIEPLGTALGTARGVALTARDKGLELLDSDAAQELLRKGQHVAIIARDRGVELLESDAAQEFVRRGKGVVSAAKGELVEKPKSRKPVKMMLLLAGSAAGIAAAVLSKRMSTPLPNSGIPTYDDPSAQFPKKDGLIDLTSVAAEEGVPASDPVKAMIEAGKAEIGSSTRATATPKAAKPAAPRATTAPKSTPPSTASTAPGASNGSPAGPTTP